jgi:histidinol dehydrogenase
MSLPVFSSNTPAFKEWLKILLRQRSVLGDGVEGAVASIVEAVRERGDQALIELTERYDHATLTKKQLRVSPKEIARALANLPAPQRRALETAAKRIREFHRYTITKSFT